MRTLCFVAFAVCGLVNQTEAGQYDDRMAAQSVSTPAPGHPRLASLKNFLASPPPGVMYNMGGYAPAGPEAINAAPGPNYDQLQSPVGGCDSCGGGGQGGLWSGYQALPCRHRHHFPRSGQGAGCGNGCGGGCDTGCGCGGGFGSYGGPAFIAPGCGCVDPCARKHCCKLFGCCKRGRGGDDCQTCQSCGSGDANSDQSYGQPSPSDAPMPQAAPEEVRPTPAEAPGPSAWKLWRLRSASKPRTDGVKN